MQSHKTLQHNTKLTLYVSDHVQEKLYDTILSLQKPFRQIPAWK
jgi:hypothetical protein